MPGFYKTENYDFIGTSYDATGYNRFLSESHPSLVCLFGWKLDNNFIMIYVKVADKSK